MIKVRKQTNPVRPIINWQNGPASRLGRLLTSNLNTHAPLPNAFSIKNTKQLSEDLQDISYEEKLKFASFNITKMYTSIPAEQLKPLILQVLRYQQTAPEVVKEIILLVDIIPKQNYFHFLNKFYIQEEGLAMGAPSPSEYFLQHLEEK
jgi:hypothetical protein